MDDELNICKLKIAVLEEKLISSKENLTLQAKEYERRLELLNGESNRLKEMQSSYVPRETYENSHKSFNEKIESLQKTVWAITGGLFVLQFLVKFFLK